MHYDHGAPPVEIGAIKQPPHSIDAEQAVLSCIMRSESALLELDIEEQHFYRREHRLIWAAAKELHEKREAVDFLTVSEALRRKGKFADAGGLQYLEELLSNVSSPANATHYAAIIKGRHIERSMIQMAHNIADIGYNGAGDTTGKLTDVYQLINQFMQSGHLGKTEVRRSELAVAEAVRRADFRFENKGDLPGLSTGFVDLDIQTNGMMRGDLIIVAGRPSMGKTTLGLNIAENVVLAGDRLVVVFSLEMQEWKLADRLLCSIARIDQSRFRKGELHDEDWDKMSRALSSLRGKALYIDEDSRLTSAQIGPRVRRIMHKENRPVDLVVVDYLGLLDDQGEGTERVTKITKTLKLTAKELNCPLIALAQLNRDVERRPNKRPGMADLRDSGSIEQDADVIIMNYRDEVYYPDSPDKGIAELILAKQRDGPVCTVRVKSNLHRCRFDNLDRNHSYHTGVAPAAPVQTNWMDKVGGV